MIPETLYEIIYKNYKITVYVYMNKTVISLYTPIGNLIHFCELNKHWWDFGMSFANKTISQIETYKRMVDERVGFHTIVTEYIEEHK